MEFPSFKAASVGWRKLAAKALAQGKPVQWVQLVGRLNTVTLPGSETCSCWVLPRTLDSNATAREARSSVAILVSEFMYSSKPLN